MNIGDIANATDLPLWLDTALALLVLMGAAFTLIGAIGLAHFSDFLRRLHGPVKASTVGVGSVLLASIGYFAATGHPELHEVLISVFIVLTAPLAANILYKAAAHEDPATRPPGAPRGKSGDADR